MQQPSLLRKKVSLTSVTVVEVGLTHLQLWCHIGEVMSFVNDVMDDVTIFFLTNTACQRICSLIATLANRVFFKTCNKIKHEVVCQTAWSSTKYVQRNYCSLKYKQKCIPLSLMLIIRRKIQLIMTRWCYLIFGGISIWLVKHFYQLIISTWRSSFGGIILKVFLIAIASVFL